MLKIVTPCTIDISMHKGHALLGSSLHGFHPQWYWVYHVHNFGMKVVFRSSHSLRSMLPKAKNALPVEKQANVVYRIPCSCGKAYIGETKRRLETRLREHQDACQTQALQKSAVVEHSWGSHLPINWKDTLVVDRARRPEELLLKVAINRNGGKGIPRCWAAALKHSEGAANQRPNSNFRQQTVASSDTQ